MAKKEIVKKKSMLPILLTIIFGFTTVLIGTYIACDKINEYAAKHSSTNNNIKKEIESNQEESIVQEESMDENTTTEVTNNSNTGGKIPTSDLFSFWVSGSNAVFLKIEDGTLYGYSNKGDDFKSGTFEAGSPQIQYKKLLDGVKRIKCFHTRTDALATFYVIMNDGRVKLISQSLDSSDVLVIRDFNMQNYQIDDILSVEGEYYDAHTVTFEVKLLDGKVIKINP